MLILSRKPGETLLIGDDIQIQIIAVKGNQVRLGITAPRNVAVDREEIAIAKAKSLEQAAFALTKGGES